MPVRDEFDSVIHCALGEANAARRHDRAGIVECRHRDLELARVVAETIFLWHKGVIEKESVRTDAARAHLVFLGTDLKNRGDPFQR